MCIPPASACTIISGRDTRAGLFLSITSSPRPSWPTSPCPSVSTSPGCVRWDGWHTEGTETLQIAHGGGENNPKSQLGAGRENAQGFSSPLILFLPGDSSSDARPFLLLRFPGIVLGSEHRDALLGGTTGRPRVWGHPRHPPHPGARGRVLSTDLCSPLG